MSKFLLSVFAGLGAMIGWGSSDFFAKISIGKAGKFRTLLWTQIIGFAFVIILSLIIGADFFISPKLLGILFVSSIMGTVGFFLLYKALEMGNASVVIPIASSYSVFSVIAAYVFLGQRVNNYQYVAIAVIIIGVILTSLEFKHVTKKLSFMKGMLEVVLFAVIIGFSIPLDDYVLNEVNWVFVSILLRLFRLIIVFVVLIVIGRKFELLKFPSEVKVPLLLVAIFDVIGHTSYVMGLSIGDSIVIAPIASALAIVTVVLSVIFLKEKLHFYQIFGIVLAVSGVITLSIV